MTKRIWTPKLYVDDLEWIIALHEYNGRYEAGQALRNLFDIELDEHNICEMKSIFAKRDAEDK